MKNKVWKLRMKKSYIDFVFEFPRAEDMVRFLDSFMAWYRPDKDDIEITVEVITVEVVEEIKEDE